jgi:hypothetical protein
MEKSFKEPIRFKWIWVVLAVITLAGVPWYLPKGTIYPIILGFPYWAFISVVSAIVLAVFLTYVINHYWDMEALKEDADEEGGNAK